MKLKDSQCDPVRKSCKSLELTLPQSNTKWSLLKEEGELQKYTKKNDDFL